MQNKYFRICCLLVSFLFLVNLLPVRACSVTERTFPEAERISENETLPDPKDDSGQENEWYRVIQTLADMVKTWISRVVQAAERGLLEMPEPGIYRRKYSDKTTRDYLEYWAYIPEAAKGDMPLIVYLHGDGEVDNMYALKSNPLYTSLQTIYGEAFPCILIAPCTRQKSWTAEDIPATLSGLIRAVKEEHHCSKVILAGYSRGAKGVWKMIDEYPEQFSAAVPVSCMPPPDWDAEQAAAVPVRAFAGNVGNEEVYYAKSMKDAVEQLKTCGADAELTILEGESHRTISNSVYSKELIEWMISQ